MVALLIGVTFAGGFLLASYILVSAATQDAGRVLTALRGQVSREPFLPLAGLVRAERRIAVRRWAGASRSPRRSMREAA